MVSVGATDAHRISLAGHGGVFAHVVAAGFDPDRVVHDPVHDGIGMNARSETLVPILLSVLGAEHCRGGVVTPFEQFQEHAAHGFVG